MVWTQRRREQMRETMRLAVELREKAMTYDEPIDWIAFLVASLTDSPLTHSQRERLAIIGRELLRRSQGISTTLAALDLDAAPAHQSR